MNICPFCNSYLEESASVCPNCGNAIPAAAPGNPASPMNYGDNPQQSQGQPYGYQPAPPVFVDPFDHTSEFSPKDISDNKVIAMLVYLLGTAGIILALIGSKDSPYVGFHVRQALKIMVCEILLGIGSILLCWTVLVPIAAVVCCVILLVLKIIAFFQICGGKAKEPAIIKNMTFLK